MRRLLFLVLVSVAVIFGSACSDDNSSGDPDYETALNNTMILAGNYFMEGFSEYFAPGSGPLNFMWTAPDPVMYVDGKLNRDTMEILTNSHVTFTGNDYPINGTTQKLEGQLWFTGSYTSTNAFSLSFLGSIGVGVGGSTQWISVSPMTFSITNTDTHVVRVISGSGTIDDNTINISYSNATPLP